ncbi:hypothetical protein KAFR_0D03730 [Kazachstania africana CBS 2517]|uniref:Vacuolar protein sorting-associated protein 75 n=1 Tax=Kazachstania africana (strain ATCC 22294 / BCRC 22015 / CBS 2517 / CECT 1963 / NBRC 1671 / NRRL Y-8276) TaxID=1071382 RepID=H2AUH1_KAZAF|nr:hypothetical protein KAFR_0D03730 [Kazachstania africana CBS 2517]CCF58021.1 hypothetical protein KAFR_0D03730 [Kazachstania africana CBS 2517]
MSKAFLELAENEVEIEKIEKEIEKFKILKYKPIYLKRDKLIDSIDSFWKIILSQHSNFVNFIRASDFKYVDCINQIIVDYDEENVGNFSITFKFNEIEGDFPAQTVTKAFKLIKIIPEDNKDSESEDESVEGEKLISESVEIIWPKSYNSINPSLIEDKKSDEGKRNYRKGMKSFFGWFKWTGLKPGKEFPHGDSFATLFSEDLYPYCVKYYTEAQRDLEDEASDSDYDSAEEPLDIDNEESENDEPPKKKSKI